MSELQPSDHTGFCALTEEPGLLRLHCNNNQSSPAPRCCSCITTENPVIIYKIYTHNQSLHHIRPLEMQLPRRYCVSINSKFFHSHPILRLVCCSSTGGHEYLCPSPGNCCCPVVVCEADIQTVPSWLRFNGWK